MELVLSSSFTCPRCGKHSKGKHFKRTGQALKQGVSMRTERYRVTKYFREAKPVFRIIRIRK